ncbi:MAG: phosphoglycerate kinase, partial [Bacteroidota bacterium]
MKLITEAALAGKRALVRVDYNVPLDDEGNVTDDRRIRESIPTVQHILSEGGSAVLMSHMGRPKGEANPKMSLEQTISTLKKYVDADIFFADNCVGDAAFEMSANLQPGQVLLLENLRFHAKEKKGDEEFAKQLARHGDLYVNDAFGSAHRAHASTATVAQFFPDAKFAGLLLNKEIENAEKVLGNAQRPYTAIMG